MRSWDRFEIPYPFSRALFHYGDPIEIPRALTPEEAESHRLKIEETLNRLAEEAERDFDRLYASAGKRKQ